MRTKPVQDTVEHMSANNAHGKANEQSGHEVMMAEEHDTKDDGKGCNKA
jgi:hypothetical protein